MTYASPSRSVTFISVERFSERKKLPHCCILNTGLLIQYDTVCSIHCQIIYINIYRDLYQSDSEFILIILRTSMCHNVACTIRIPTFEYTLVRKVPLVLYYCT